MADRAPQIVASGRFGVRELIEEAQREAFMRRRVYPNQVRAGRLSQEDADRRIDLMEAIVTRLTRTAGVE
ncbi:MULTISPECIES: hypothetical protein [Pseudomonadota]|uniref:hypothetical protein n=1 Tax=Pseudomonadota TaxID=1224 RepID=UPI002AFFC8A6|nr:MULTISPECIES: hypothetical protein [Pseudomonadota]